MVERCFEMVARPAFAKIMEEAPLLRGFLSIAEIVQPRHSDSSKDLASVARQLGSTVVNPSEGAAFRSRRSRVPTTRWLEGFTRVLPMSRRYVAITCEVYAFAQ